MEHWHARGHQILVIDNFATGKRELVPQISRLQVVEGSIADREMVRRAFDRFRPTVVVHSAASYKDPSDWREDAATNVLGTVHVIEAARDYGVERFLNFQTVLCYGRPEQSPIPVDHPLRPFTSYGISKVAGEQYLAASNLNWVSLRLANITGPRLAIGPIPTFYQRLKAQQSCFCTDSLRDFLDMSDFIAAVECVITAPEVSGIFNVSSGQGHSIREVYDAVRTHLGLGPDPGVRVVPVGADDVAELVPDPSKTSEALGWKPQVNFRSTMERMLKWYDVHGVSDVHSHLSHAKYDEQDQN
jgi:nucleoside-diphosphate-sugar epimerase